MGDSPPPPARSRFGRLRSLKERDPAAFGTATALTALGAFFCCIVGPVAWSLVMGLIAILSGRLDLASEELVGSILLCEGPLLIVGGAFFLVAVLILKRSGNKRRVDPSPTPPVDPEPAATEDVREEDPAGEVQRSR